MLAILLMAEGRAVTVRRLIDHMWDGDPPPSAVNTLRSYTSRLRSRLRKACGEQLTLDSSSGTYRLQVKGEAVDLSRFRSLCHLGRQAVDRGDTEVAVSLFRQAETLRRAEPLADLTGLWAASVRERLREELREVTETRIRLELTLGRHAQLISELRELANRTPVVEPVVADLMTALYRCGRTAEALAAYQTARHRLDEELGLEPSSELQSLHERVLRRDRDLLQPMAPSRPNLAPVDTLLRDIADFTGRSEEIDLLTRELGGTGTPAVLPLAVVHGMPGVGKTQLAIRVANLLRERYPDALYLDLATHNRQQPMDPGAALTGLLTQLGLPSANLPAGQDERASLWRESMSRRKAIIILDDARDSAQVRPLLPGTPGCSVLVTSRHRLTDLEGARSLSLEVPPPSQASELFARVAGRARITNHEAVRRVVDLCGCHPIAVRLAAARLRHRESWDIEDLADHLAAVPSILDEIGTPAGITAAFAVCYAELEPDQRHLFRRLALHPGPDLSIGVAAALVGTDESVVRHSLDALLDGHLVEESGRDRVRMHDLLKAFGRDMAEREDSLPEREVAVERMLDRYLADAARAERLTRPYHPLLELPPPRTPSAGGNPAPTRLRTADEGQAWLDLERANLLAAGAVAATRSGHHAVYFPHVLAHSFLTWSVWEAGTDLCSAALNAAADSDNSAVTAQLLVEIASLLWNQGAHDEAAARAEEALAIGREQNLYEIQAQALVVLSRAHLIATRRAESMECLDRALGMFRAAGNAAGEAATLNMRGIAHSHAGSFQEAAETFRKVLDISARIGDGLGQVKALNNLGEIRHILGRPAEALDYYERSLRLVRNTGGRSQLSNLYTNFGNAFHALGNTEEALVHYRRALDAYRETADPRGEADVLICIGTTYLETGRHLEARPHFQMAEHVAGRIGDQYARQKSLVGAAYVQLRSRQFGLSITTFEEALRAAEEIDIPLAVARALEGLATATEVARGSAAASDFFARAHTIYAELGLPEAETLRAKLNAPGAAGP